LKKKNQATTQQSFLKGTSLLLFGVLTVMLSGYFAWSESTTFNMLFKLISRLLMTMAIYLIYRRIAQRGAIPSFGWKNGFSPLLYVVYLGLGLLSFLWSTDVAYSALQWCMDVAGLVFAYYFVACFIMLDRYFPNHPIRLYKILAHGIFLLMIVFVIGFFADPAKFVRMTHEGEEHRLGGFIMNPNELGMLAGVGIACYILCLYEKGQRVWTILRILILLFAVVLTGSRSTIIGVLIIAFYHVSQSAIRWFRYLMYVSAAVIIPLVVNTLIVKSAGNGGLDEVLSMTGRIPFWTALVTKALPREPLLGYGFQRINYTLNFSGAHTYTASMAHNTFLQALMNLGLIGFVVVLLQVFFTIRAFLLTTDNKMKLIIGSLLIPVLINSFTEFGIFGETNFGILLYQVLILYLSLRINPRLSGIEKLFLRQKRPDLITA
jgi:exopolysaccharide production protein ExoQ